MIQTNRRDSGGDEDEIVGHLFIEIHDLGSSALIIDNSGKSGTW